MRKSLLFLIVIYMAAFVFSSCGRSEKDASASASMFERDDAVKNAYLSILDDRVASVRDEIYGSLDRYGAAVESESWDDAGKADESIAISIRVPSAGFMDYVNYIKFSFAVDSLRMYARKTTEKSAPNGEVDANGIVYSMVRVSIARFGASVFVID